MPTTEPTTRLTSNLAHRRRQVGVPLAVAVAASIAACGVDDAPAATTTTTATTTSATGGAGGATTSTPTGGAGGASTGTGGGHAGGSGGGSATPIVSDALDCGKKGTAGGLAPGKSPSMLVRHAIDGAAFPDAICNDGTPAVFYFRPAITEADADKWVIQLQGGGSCQGGDECAARWCSVGTAFSMVGMSSAPAPADGIDGQGILNRSAEGPLASPSPIEGYNQVFVKYCSSDKWLGTQRDAVLDGHHPVTQAPVTYRAHFLGRRILEATIATLRADGVPALEYDGAAMPDLDDATVLVLAGASGGGAGVLNNGDYVAAELGKHAAGLAEVRVLADSIMGPERVDVGFEKTPFCADSGICTGEDYLKASEAQQRAAWKPLRDASCVAHHPGEEWRCADESHLALNHVTTPLFVRMGLTDELLSGPYVDGTGLTDADGQPYDLKKFGAKVREQLLALGSIQTTAEEAADIAVEPAAFGPICSKHETLRSDADTFEVTIDPGSGPRTMFDVFTAWRGGDAGQLVSSSKDDTFCPK